LIGSIGAVALALVAPGVVHAYPTMPDGEPIHVASRPGRLPPVQRTYSTMPPEAVDGVPVARSTEMTLHPSQAAGVEPTGSGWNGAGLVVAASILAALTLLAATHVLNRQLRRSAMSRRIGG
jgi:hypothetical protein